jgi:hypothetical protein
MEGSAMTVLPFSDLLALAGPPSLVGKDYRRALQMLRVPAVRAEAHSCDLWVPAVRWALHHDRHYEQCALRILAVQPDVLGGRRTVAAAEAIVVPAPVVRSRSCPGDRYAVGRSAMPADLTDPDDLIARFGFDLVDMIEQATSIVMTTPARDFLLWCWERYARALAADPTRLGQGGLAELVGPAQIAERKSTRSGAWGQAVLAATSRTQRCAARRLLLGTPTRPGVLVWVGQRRSLDQVPLHVVASWAVAAASLDPAVAAAPDRDALNAAVRRRAIRHVSRWGESAAVKRDVGRLQSRTAS